MRSFVITRCAAVAFALTTGCSVAPKHLGNWAFQDHQTNVWYSFEAPDKCRFVGAANGSPGIGGYCRYKAQNGTLTIAEVWDQSEIPQMAPARYQLTYDPTTDTLSLRADGKEIRLSRTSKEWK